MIQTEIQLLKRYAHHREQKYVDEMSVQNQDSVDQTLFLPHIHDALARLPQADREAVVLRFLQNKSLQEVGADLGISSDAARMRIHRALSRMNRYLSRKGISTTVAALLLRQLNIEI